MANELALDTGILLLHALSAFEGGRFLREVRGDVAEEEVSKVAAALRSLLAGSRLITTPHILTEFKHLVETRAGIKGDRLTRFLQWYSEPLAKLLEEPIPVGEILLFEEEEDIWWLCFADTSLVLTAKKRGATIFTADRRLYEWCSRNRVEARHIVSWYYS